jgi:ABC-type microcin C transport system permease subunit YejB
MNYSSIKFINKMIEYIYLLVHDYETTQMLIFATTASFKNSYVDKWYKDNNVTTKSNILIELLYIHEDT